MDIQLVRVDINEANDLWEMQVASFLDLYEKYQDTDTSPTTESVDKILMRLNQPFTYYYFIKLMMPKWVLSEWLINVKRARLREYRLSLLCLNIETKDLHREQYS